MSRRSSARIAAALAASATVITFVAAAWPQEKAALTAPPIGTAKGREEPPLAESKDSRIGASAPEKHPRRAEIDRLIEVYDLKPHALPSIPADPPPHEGAMIDYPFPVEPPDMLQVEVLEALPGRPISGERLVQPDGTIDLGFYGLVHVRGLTPVQIKVAIIKHLRKYLGDEVLGLVSSEECELPPTERKVSPPPELPPDANPFDDGAKGNTDPSPAKPQPKVGSRVQAGDPTPEAQTGETYKLIPPQDSDRVMVYLTAYNSKNYYILGDILIPGRLPHTGNETVLDVLQYAGGLLPTADPKDIRLVRPGRNGKPSKVYKVDLEAIQDRGDVRSNYQIFPGDRLIVGRNEVVKKTIEIDRLQAPIQAIVSSIQQNVNMLKSLRTLTPAEGDEVLKDLVDFWAKEVSRKGELKFDEQTLRELLLRQLKKAPPAARPGPEPGAK